MYTIALVNWKCVRMVHSTGLVFLHRMGHKVSHYISELYGDLLSSVAGLKPEVEVLENEFIMKFTFS